MAHTFKNNSSDKQYDKNFLSYKRAVEQIELNIEDNNEHEINTPFTEYELNEAINNLSRNTSPGSDNIANEMIQHLSPITKSYILKLYNHIWTKHTFPDLWRQAIIIPIPKPNKCKSDPNNYRPISLTSCMCKTLEKMINKRLVWYLETNKIISNVQCGFRPNRSTTDQLVIFNAEIQKAFQKKTGTNGNIIRFRKGLRYDLETKYLEQSD